MGLQMSAPLKSLRERVAEAIRGDGDTPWGQLSDDRKAGWLGDADRAIPIVLAAAARVATQTDPEKPSTYLFKRERIGDAIEGLFLGYQDDEARQ
jgi:hypothetical protein